MGMARVLTGEWVSECVSACEDLFEWSGGWVDKLFYFILLIVIFYSWYSSNIIHSWYSSLSGDHDINECSDGPHTHTHTHILDFLSSLLSLLIIILYCPPACLDPLPWFAHCFFSSCVPPVQLPQLLFMTAISLSIALQVVARCPLLWDASRQTSILREDSKRLGYVPTTQRIIISRLTCWCCV